MNRKRPPAKPVVDQDVVPGTLDEALSLLLSDFDDVRQREVCAISELDFRAMHHLRSGTWVRNSWSLWTDSMLKQWFEARGVFHPDDMSGIIFTSLYREIVEKPRNLKTQIQEYKAHWKKHAPLRVGGMCGVWHCSCSRLIAKCKCGAKKHELQRVVTNGCTRCLKLT